MTVLLRTPKILQFEHCTWRFCQLKFLGPTGSKRTHHMHTQHSGSALLYRLHPSQWCRASRWGSWCNQRFVDGAVDERQFPENQQAPITFLGAITNVIRDQSRVFDSAGFGDEERADVENIDAVKLMEKLETLETSCLLDISRNVTGF